MTDCPFCDIAAGRGDLPDRLVQYRDVVVFEPLRPVTEGHLLVVPRQHVTDAAACPEAAAVAMERAGLLARDLPAANIITSIGAAASQTVEHLHLHVVPRAEGDGLALPWTSPRRPDLDAEPLSSSALRNALRYTDEGR